MLLRNMGGFKVQGSRCVCVCVCVCMYVCVHNCVYVCVCVCLLPLSLSATFVVSTLNMRYVGDVLGFSQFFKGWGQAP